MKITYNAYEKAAVVSLVLAAGALMGYAVYSTNGKPSGLTSKCSEFADAKARSGGSRQLSFNSCMQFDGDPADAWKEGK